MGDRQSTKTSRSARDPILRPARTPPHRYRMTRRGRFVRRLITGIGLLLVVLLVSGVAFFFYAKHKIDSKAVTCTSCVAVQPAAAGEVAAPFNVLVLGSDTRSVLNAQDQQYFDPTGQDRNSGQRSDTIAVIHVIPATGKAIAVNLPRDLRVPTADGRGYQKINGFYNNGVSAMVTAVEKFSGLDINHYIEINFDSFRTITDALGGVNVRFARKVVDPNSGLNQPAGCNLLTGNQALAFVRDRDTDSDFGRIARQQLFIKLMMNKVLTPGTLLNPIKVANLINLGLGTVSHDSGLSLSTMTSLALHFHSFSASDIDFRVVPSAPENIDGGNYVVPNQAQTKALFDAIKNGTALPDYGKQGVSSIDASSVRVAVLNGTATPGLAARVAATLTAKGYRGAGTTNADAQTYAETVVYYTPGNQAQAQYLASTQFPGAQLVAEPPAIASIVAARGMAVDAVVVLGANAVSTGTSASPLPSPSPTALLPAGPAQALMTSVPWFSAC